MHILKYKQYFAYTNYGRLLYVIQMRPYHCCKIDVVSHVQLFSIISDFFNKRNVVYNTITMRKLACFTLTCELTYFNVPNTTQQTLTYLIPLKQPH